ncbi:MAG: hypothetical protein OXP73_03985, partial [Chloroflexota bacterium]|nr:hypothetical protein [Chloroflexota bacterium]
MMTVLAFNALGRLAPGVSPEQATAEVSALLQGGGIDLRMLGAAGRRGADSRPENAVRVVPLLEEMVGEYRPALLALTVATAL